MRPHRHIHTHTHYNHNHKYLYHMHADISTAVRHVKIPGRYKTLTNDKRLRISWGYLLNTRKWLPACLRGPRVWQSLPWRFPADDTLFELIANFLIPESLTFFNKWSPGDFGLICGRHRHVAELGNLTYVHVFEWEGRQKVKQVHHTSVPSDCGHSPLPLHWRHNDHDGVSNHQPHGCLLNHLFRRRS